MKPQYINQCILSFFCLTIAGCAGHLQSVHENHLERLQIVVEPNVVNQPLPELDLIFIHDKDLIKAVPKTSTEWFANREKFQVSFSKKRATVMRVTLKLGMYVNTDFPSLQSGAISVWSIANLHYSNSPPTELSSRECSLITFKEKTVNYSECLATSGTSNQSN
jgi:hypothetical protein